MSSEEKMFVVDLYTDKQTKWMKDYDFCEAENQYGKYYTITVPQHIKSLIIKKAYKSHIRYKQYEKRWSRSNDYRKEFFKYNPPPYRCRYCHKKLAVSQVVVDHLIPIAKVKKSGTARNLLYLQGVKDVNDIRNLVPSCYTCNKRKGANMGLWFIRGVLGKYKLYWFLLKVFIVLLVIMFLLIIIEVNNSNYFF